MNSERDAATAEAARRLAAGPLGRRLSEFPLLFARAALIAERRSRSGVWLTNGTATLIDFGRGPLAIACAHVLDEYRCHRGSGGSVTFQIGSVELDPTAQLVAEDPRVDLATIRLSENQAAVLMADEGMGACFFRPVSWPPTSVKENDSVALGGFPGEWRERTALDELTFNGYGIGATAVTSVSEAHFACRFERDRWVWSYRRDELVDPKELGGLSGGPAFIERRLHWELVGIIYEFSSTLDIMRLRPAHVVRADGSICDLP
jgi:hypothetical protein